MNPRLNIKRSTVFLDISNKQKCRVLKDILYIFKYGFQQCLVLTKVLLIFKENDALRKMHKNLMCHI